MNASVETMAFLHAHGLDVHPGDLNAQLLAAINALKALYYANPGQEGLTAAEKEVARSGGLDPEPSGGRTSDPLLQGVFAYASLVETGLTTLEAADRLGVSDARIRQRLKDRTLTALRDGRAWKLPLFQFTEEGELPGWGEVARSLPLEVSAVAVARWLWSSNTELAAGEDEEPRTPREWLLEGRPAAAVAALARDLG